MTDKTNGAADQRNTIVAEVSKSYTYGKEVEPGLLSQRFELVIETNRQRGYKLRDWQLARCVTAYGESLNESIIAVFEKA